MLMKLSRRQFMKKAVAAGVVIPSVSAIAKEKKYPNFDSTEFCFWDIDHRIRPLKRESVGKIIVRRIKQSIPPAYRDKLLVFYRFEEYHMALRTIIIYRPKEDFGAYIKKAQWTKEDGWHRYQ